MRWPATSSPKAAQAQSDDRDAGDDDVERYEQLRERALAGDGAGWQLGLALLQRRGVTAWTRAWPRQAQPAGPRARPPTPVPAAAGEQLVGVLATMALARLAA